MPKTPRGRWSAVDRADAVPVPALSAATVLEWLLPGHGARFRTDVWERGPLLVRAGATGTGRFAALLSRREVEAMLARDPRFAANVMVCRADATGRRTDGTPTDGPATAAALWAQYAAGFTLQVFQPQQHAPAVAALCRALEVTRTGPVAPQMCMCVYLCVCSHPPNPPACSSALTAPPVTAVRMHTHPHTPLHPPIHMHSYIHARLCARRRSCWAAWWARTAT
jgi:hypothetical protein